MSKDTSNQTIPADFEPGSSVTGIYIYTDRSTGTAFMQLLKGARGSMSIYEMPDELFERLAPGMLLNGKVDRVEFDTFDNMTVIVAGEHFRQA